jgi:hypothetical protein
MKKILISLRIIQIVSNKQRGKQGLKTLGSGYSESFRFNPYNPLTYITLGLILIIGILMFGFVGVWKEVDIRNPFKWN